MPDSKRKTTCQRPGLIYVIFRKAQNKIQDPAKLRRLIVDLIDKARPSTGLRDSPPPPRWSSLSADVKGDAYEGLLQKNADDVKGGAGQYFTARLLIAAIVDVVAQAEIYQCSYSGLNSRYWKSPATRKTAPGL